MLRAAEADGGRDMPTVASQIGNQLDRTAMDTAATSGEASSMSAGLHQLRHVGVDAASRVHFLLCLIVHPPLL